MGILTFDDTESETEFNSGLRHTGQNCHAATHLTFRLLGVAVGAVSGSNFRGLMTGKPPTDDQAATFPSVIAAD